MIHTIFITRLYQTTHNYDINFLVSLYDAHGDWASFANNRLVLSCLLIQCRCTPAICRRFTRSRGVRLPLQEPPNEWPSVFETYGLAYARSLR